MANTSEELINSTLDFLSSSTFVNCLNRNNFGFVFSSLTTALCFLLGTPVHLWCICFYFGTEKKIKETQVFFLNHTIMEIIYSLECGIEMLNTFVFNNDKFGYLISFFFGLCWTGRPLLQTCTCIEQYVAVLHPVTFLRYKGIKYRTAAAAAAWLMAFVFGVCESNGIIFIDLIYSFVFIIALAFISFGCVSVLCALKHPRPGENHITNQTGRDRGNQQKRNAFNTIFSALCLILFTYFPQILLIVFTRNRLHWMFFECNISLFLTSLNDFGVIATPLLKLYKDSHFKMSKVLMEIKMTA